MKIANKALLITSIIMLSLGLFACDKDKKAKQKIVKPVKTMVISQAKDKAIRNFPGKVLPFKEATLSFLVSGQVIKLPVLEGDQVKTKQLIASVDPKKYQNQVSEMNAKYLRNKAEYERAY